jgi:cytochrome c-type biogenesis protein CcmH
MSTNFLGIKRLVQGVLFLLAAVAVATAQSKEAEPSAKEPLIEKRLIHISEELRCLVCQNESLASSRAELANDLREEVRLLIRQDKSDDAIKAYLVERYGDFVLYRPEVKPLTWLLWFGPFALLLCGVVGMVLYVRQRQAVQKLVQPLSEKERDQVRVLLKTGESP